jgi:bisphosphoglycerate-dependent phosphoglycerate mutase
MPVLNDLTLYVLRHGECEHNVEGRFASHDDSPLTANGREQAREGRVVTYESLPGHEVVGSLKRVPRTRWAVVSEVLSPFLPMARSWRSARSTDASD